MGDTIPARDNRIHRDHVLGVAITDGLQRSELAFNRCLTGHHVGDLNVATAPVSFNNEIYLALVQLSHIHLHTARDQLVVDYRLNDAVPLIFDSVLPKMEQSEIAHILFSLESQFLLSADIVALRSSHNVGLFDVANEVVNRWRGHLPNRVG